MLFRSDKDQLVSTSSDTTLKIWSATSGQCLQTLQGHSCYVLSVIYLPDKDLLVSASWDTTLKIWSTTSGQCLQTLQGHRNGVNSVIYLPDKDQLVSTSLDKTLKIWFGSLDDDLDMFPQKKKQKIQTIGLEHTKLENIKLEDSFKKTSEGFNVTQTLQGHNSVVYSVIYIPDKDQLVSASGDKTLKRWSATSGQCLQTLQGHSYDVNSVIYLPDKDQRSEGAHV